jgi:hypothetical protein
MMESVRAASTTQMRLTALLVATTLAALPVRAQERPASALPQEASSAKPEAQAGGLAPGAAPQPADTSPPVSMARVREQLKKKPSIVAPLPKADFKVTIEQRRPLQEMFYVPPWATSSLAQSKLCAPRGASYLPSNCGSPAGFSADPGTLWGSLKGAFNARAARDEVRRTIIEYCAAQPNGGAGIKICAEEAR